MCSNVANPLSGFLSIARWTSRTERRSLSFSTLFSFTILVLYFTTQPTKLGRALEMLQWRLAARNSLST